MSCHHTAQEEAPVNCGLLGRDHSCRAASVFTLAPARAWGRPRRARTRRHARANGHPDLQGVWQVLNAAAWNVEDHQRASASPRTRNCRRRCHPYHRPRSRSGRQFRQPREARSRDAVSTSRGFPDHLMPSFRIVQQADRVTICTILMPSYVFMNGSHIPGPDRLVDG